LLIFTPLKVSLEALLDDPFCLEPPVMSFKGEFLAELDDDAVFDALRFYDVDGGGVVKTSSVGVIMTELGSDWDEDELAEAEAAMDPSGKGFITYETFRTWWGN
jgi:Ca2+-binding EF-hand superfamily protein